VLLALIACRSNSPLHPVAGDDKDEGHGDLASASAKLMTSEDSGADPFAPRRKRQDDAFGGTTYGSYVVPNWTSPTAVHRTYPRHQQQVGLAGAIEGTITWKGALPGKRAMPCGPQPLVRVGDNRGIANVVLYIENVKTGRTMPTDGRSAAVGGALVKKGCLLLPTAQIVTPLPAAISLHGDTAKAKLRVTTTGTPRIVELQEGGRSAVPAVLGVTKIDSEDGSLSAAWVLWLDAPYYAITDDKGQFRIDELAPGTYEVTIWHAPLPNTSGPLQYGAPIVIKKSVTVAGTKPARLDLSIGR
jgi:hypothetical protein